MNNKLCVVGLTIILLSVGIHKLSAQSNNNDLYENMLISDEIKNEAEALKAQNSASQLLDSAPKKIDIDSPLLRAHQQKIEQRKRAEARAKQNKTLKEKEAAPFGLVWGASYTEVKDDGVTLTEVGQKDYVNNFSATHLPKNIRAFREVILTFGIENELWRIIAYGNFLDDTPSAEKVLSVYNQYYKLLEEKYGNAQQFYTPNVINIDKPLGNGKTETIQQEQAIGNSNFLQELQNGQAFLYATFENSNVGAALSVNVDGQGKSYITIEYKNLNIMRAREQSTLDAL